jgi:hypothetical protein
VVKGGTARFVWNYTVDNRTEEFLFSSPRWSFYDVNDTIVDIGYENYFNNWQWNINLDTCPPRLLNPTRVRKESTATLVISNVTTADSGTYEFVLLLKTSSPIRSKVQLIVTSKCIYSIENLSRSKQY